MIQMLMDLRIDLLVNIGNSVAKRICPGRNVRHINIFPDMLGNPLLS